MFRIIQSPTIIANISSPSQQSGPGRQKYQRYSSMDQLCNSKSQLSRNSLKFIDLKHSQQKNTNQKTARTQKQRAHSQKKLTLTSTIPVNSTNGTYNNNIISNQNNQNLSFINTKDAYEGFKKNLQLSSNLLNKGNNLQKKGKYTSMKTSQTGKFTPSSTNIRYESQTIIQEKQNEYQGNESYLIQTQKQRSRALIQKNSNNNYASTNPQTFYKPNFTCQTAPSSPVYTIQKKTNTESSPKLLINLQKLQTKKDTQSQQIIRYFAQKFETYKQSYNKILFENAMKIKQLQSILVQNKQSINLKNLKIRQLEKKLQLNQKSENLYSPTKDFYNHYQVASYNTYLKDFNSSLVDKSMVNKHFDLLKIQEFAKIAIKNNFLSQKISDIQIKLQIISNYSNQNQNSLNFKIDKLNYFLQNFISVKFHNLKFTLKTFITKNQRKMGQINDNIQRVYDIIKLDQIQSYQKLLQKTKENLYKFEKIIKINNEEIIKVDDLKMTLNTDNSSLRNKTTQQSFHNMSSHSKQINDSFWNNIEDFSLNQSNLQDQSFTDDSFSYVSRLNSKQINLNAISTSNSSCNQFPLGSFPSFSKFSIDTKFSKQSVDLSKASNFQPLNNCIQALEQISKFRKGPVITYIDQNGYLRYKGSQSCIFDRKGNILKPSKAEVEYCLAKKLIIIQ